MMTGTDAPAFPGDPALVPLTLELLADLHAGVFDEPLATLLRRRVAADPRAGAVLAALDATVADLATVADQQAARIPDRVASRLDSTLAIASATRAVPEHVDRPRADPPRRRRRAGWSGVALAVAAAAAIGVLALSGMQLDTAGSGLGGDALDTAIGIQSPEPPVLTRDSLHLALEQALQTRDYGPLSPPPRLRSCLRANEVALGAAPLGALEVTLDGRRGVLLVLPTSRIEQLRLLVVSPNCGSAGPATLADQLMIR